MLTTIPLLTALIFSSVYPLCFWISARDPLKNNFHRFHLGLPNFVGGIAVVGLLFFNVSLTIKILAILWKIYFLFVSRQHWRKETMDVKKLTLPCLLGILVFIQVQGKLIGSGLDKAFGSVLAGAILCVSMYAMNLGHWYLNVHGLPLSHLVRTVYVFWALVAIRFLWDVFILLTVRVVHFGDSIPLYVFVQRLDGCLLLIGILFGTLLPGILLYYVRGTLQVKSTQSATGILYVILTSVFMGDLAYKYYLIKFGLAL